MHASTSINAGSVIRTSERRRSPRWLASAGPVTDVTGGPRLKFGNEVLTTVVAGVVTPSGQVKLTCKS